MRSRTTRKVLAAMVVGAIVFILGAWRLTDVWRDLFVNLGAGLVGAVLTFLIFEIFDRVFEYAVAKYGSFDFQRVLAVRACAPQ